MTSRSSLRIPAAVIPKAVVPQNSLKAVAGKQDAANSVIASKSLSFNAMLAQYKINNLPSSSSSSSTVMMTPSVTPQSNREKGNEKSTSPSNSSNADSETLRQLQFMATQFGYQVVPVILPTTASESPDQLRTPWGSKRPQFPLYPKRTFILYDVYILCAFFSLICTFSVFIFLNYIFASKTYPLYVSPPFSFSLNLFSSFFFSSLLCTFSSIFFFFLRILFL